MLEWDQNEALLVDGVLVEHLFVSNDLATETK